LEIRDNGAAPIEPGWLGIRDESRSLKTEVHRHRHDDRDADAIDLGWREFPLTDCFDSGLVQFRNGTEHLRVTDAAVDINRRFEDDDALDACVLGGGRIKRPHIFHLRGYLDVPADADGRHAGRRNRSAG